MKSYILYDPATGRITQQGISASNDLSHLESITGCKTIESPPVKQWEYTVVDGKLQRKTDEDIEKDKPKKAKKVLPGPIVTTAEWNALVARVEALEK